MRERIINNFLHKEVTEKKCMTFNEIPNVLLLLPILSSKYIDSVRPYLRMGSAFDVRVRNPTVWIDRTAPSIRILLRIWPHWRSSSSWTTSVEASMVSNTVDQTQLTSISIRHSFVTTCGCCERVNVHQLIMIQYSLENQNSIYRVVHWILSKGYQEINCIVHVPIQSWNGIRNREVFTADEKSCTKIDWMTKITPITWVNPKFLKNRLH